MKQYKRQLKSFYWTNQLIDRTAAREQELKIKDNCKLVTVNPFYADDGTPTKEIAQIDAGQKTTVSPEEIVGRDLKLIKDCDGLIAYLSSDKNMGSCMEIAIASCMWSKPVYVIATQDHLASHPWVVYFANKVFRSSFEFIQWWNEELDEK